MTQPRWVDEHGRPQPNAAVPAVPARDPVNRWPLQTLSTQLRRP